MKIEINGNYRTVDLIVVFQHLIAQLEALGVEAVEEIYVELAPLNARERRLGLADDAGRVDHLSLEISDLARPCVGTGKLRVVEAIAKPRTIRGPAPRAAKEWHRSKKH